MQKLNELYFHTYNFFTADRQFSGYSCFPVPPAVPVLLKDEFLKKEVRNVAELIYTAHSKKIDISDVSSWYSLKLGFLYHARKMYGLNRNYRCISKQSIRQSAIYAILANDTAYVGQSADITRRLAAHYFGEATNEILQKALSSNRDEALVEFYHFGNDNKMARENFEDELIIKLSADWKIANAGGAAAAASRLDSRNNPKLKKKHRMIKFIAISPEGASSSHDDITAFAQLNRLDEKHIVKCIRGVEGTHRGWRFKYAE